METPSASFPATLEIDYLDRPLNKLTSFFRPFMAIPILIILVLISGSSGTWGCSFFLTGAGGVLFFPTLLTLLFLHKYPRWWFDWNVELIKFSTRCSAYLFLLRDEYPSIDEEQGVHITIPYPDVVRLSPGMPLFKWFLAILHYIVLWALGIAAIVCVIIAWFAILFTAHRRRCFGIQSLCSILL